MTASDVQTGCAPVPQRAADLTFLVVDDFGTMRAVIVGLLRQLGYSKTVEAEDGVQAIQAFERHDVGFVVTDWSMPKLTGIELVRHIRGDAEHAGVPILLVTAEARMDFVVEAAQAGADGFIVKPFSAEALRQRLLRIFAKRGIEA